jgi:hypothetical protein
MERSLVMLVFCDKDLDLEKISSTLKMDATRGQRKGDRCPDGDLVRIERWEKHLSPLDTEVRVEGQIEAWLDILLQRQAEFRLLTAEGLNPYLDCRSDFAEVSLTKDTISKLSLLNIEICFESPFRDDMPSLAPVDQGFVLQIPEPEVFYSDTDEKNFFNWLSSIAGVDRVESTVVENISWLRLILKKQRLDPHSLRTLVALLQRYGLGMSSLQSQCTPENEEWFADRQTYWYHSVFGNQPS